MNTVLQRCAFVAVFAIASCFVSNATAKAGGWAWQKPLHLKAGSAFYTTNLKKRRDYYGSRHRAYRPRMNTIYSHPSTLYQQYYYQVPTYPWSTRR